MDIKHLFFILLTIYGCSDTDSPTPQPNIPAFTAEQQLQFSIDSQLIADYLLVNQIAPDFYDEDGIWVDIDTIGNTDIRPQIGDVICLQYQGYTLQNFTFDEQNQDTTLLLGNQIWGWQVGIRYLKEGGRATLYIPSVLAFRDNPPNDLLFPNQPVVYEIELKEVK